MKKKVLLLSPLFKGLHTDIINGLYELGYDVNFISIESSMRDPYNKRGRFQYPKFIYDKILKKRWEKILSGNESIYDVLFVIDGQSLHSIIFSLLKKRNSNLLCVNYLFDSISGVYDFKHNFQLFDKVYTFDRVESLKYGITCLPIYWIYTDRTKFEFDLFGMGGYNPERYKFFKIIQSISQKLSLYCYVKLFSTKIVNQRWYSIKYKVRCLLGLSPHISLSEYNSKLITFDSYPPNEFREKIANSNVIIDTSPIHQSGLTARFMWALGLRKKIITSCLDVVNYPFYSKNNILVLDSQNIDVDSVDSFLSLEYDKSNLDIIDSFRIDNWLKTILSSDD